MLGGYAGCKEMNAHESLCLVDSYHWYMKKFFVCQFLLLLVFLVCETTDNSNDCLWLSTFSLLELITLAIRWNNICINLSFNFSCIPLSLRESNKRKWVGAGLKMPVSSRCHSYISSFFLQVFIYFCYFLSFKWDTVVRLDGSGLVSSGCFLYSS